MTDQPILVAATDGNYGRAVSRVGLALRTPVEIHAPSFTPSFHLDAIRLDEARLVVETSSYVDAVEEAYASTLEPGRVAVLDTGLASYSQTAPEATIDGYCTLFHEAWQQLRIAKLPPPTHVVVPIGVGGLAAAALRSTPSQDVHVIGVEPVQAAPCFSSLQSGYPTSVFTGQSVMTGLLCGSISLSAWNDLRHLRSCVLVDDIVCQEAMDLLLAEGLGTGPTGAAATAGLLTIEAAKPAQRLLGLDQGARPLIIVTEPEPHNKCPER